MCRSTGCTVSEHTITSMILRKKGDRPHVISHGHVISTRIPRRPCACVAIVMPTGVLLAIEAYVLRPFYLTSRTSITSQSNPIKARFHKTKAAVA
ncbi:hypothetical protein DM02DRAFT_331921 [Periconia macrospinosa]|uniref:Uncharacterized protein n=1 Tax=Periconia macrospinosa TaxID=97972 RepID=A0A2V1DYF7_9PLEO|nr:hypothetical protein DM02DRAFT_331921 [Periconia macrospinosa]